MIGKWQTFVWIREDWPVENRVKLPVENRVKLPTEKKASRKPEQKDQTKKKDRKKKKEVRIEVLNNPHQSPLGRWLTIIRFQIVAVLARLIFWRKFNDLLEFTLATINLLSGLEAVSSILAYIGGTCWSFNCRVICCDLSLLHNVHYKVYYFVI